MSQEDLVYGTRKPKFPKLWENEWFWFSDSGGRQWLFAQPIQNDLVEVKAMNTGGRSEEGDDKFQHRNSWFRPRDTCSTKLRSRAFEEGRIVSQTQESTRSAGEVEGRRTQQILKRVRQQMRESQEDKIFQYVGEACWFYTWNLEKQILRANFFHSDSVGWLAEERQQTPCTGNLTQRSVSSTGSSPAPS